MRAAVHEVVLIMGGSNAPTTHTRQWPHRSRYCRFPFIASRWVRKLSTDNRGRNPRAHSNERDEDTTGRSEAVGFQTLHNFLRSRVMAPVASGRVTVTTRPCVCGERELPEVNTRVILEPCGCVHLRLAHEHTHSSCSVPPSMLSTLSVARRSAFAATNRTNSALSSALANGFRGNLRNRALPNLAYRQTAPGGFHHGRLHRGARANAIQSDFGRKFKGEGLHQATSPAFDAQ